MRISLISDDLTGASDAGVQLVQYGLNVSVAFDHDTSNLSSKDGVIFNTDSRSVSGEEAYRRVKEICEKIKDENFDVIYKKIDSTMRGNIGKEINAVYDVFRPDFVFIAPAYPETGRKVVDGIHYLNEIKLHETEVGNDPKTPVKDSLISRLVQDQSGRPVRHLSYKELNKGNEYILKRLAAFKKQKIFYVTVDSVDEADLEDFVKMIKNTSYTVIWSGSAGLLNYLPRADGLKASKKEVALPYHEKPVLFVIGSVSKVGRGQLNHLLVSTNVIGIELDSTKMVTSSNAKKQELTEFKQKAISAMQSGKSVALLTSLNLKETQLIGERQGFNAVEISDIISNALGQIAVSLINELDIRRLFLTGGDTAQQVLYGLNANEYHLIGELEVGIPIGKLEQNKEIIVITKAGNFGSEAVMTKAFDKLQGDK